jgi:hypothetical protein
MRHEPLFVKSSPLPVLLLLLRALLCLLRLGLLICFFWLPVCFHVSISRFLPFRSCPIPTSEQPSTTMGAAPGTGREEEVLSCH